MKFWEELTKSQQKMVENFRADMTAQEISCAVMNCCILENGDLVSTDIVTCCLWQGKHNDQMIVGKEQVGHYEVSTCFSCVPLGFDLNHKPEHFETMLFSKDGEFCAHRYDTLKEAQQGHKKIVDNLKKEAVIS